MFENAVWEICLLAARTGPAQGKAGDIAHSPHAQNFHSQTASCTTNGGSTKLQVPWHVVG